MLSPPASLLKPSARNANSRTAASTTIRAAFRRHPIAKTPDNKYNDYGIGICVVGNNELSDAAKRSVSELYRLANARCGKTLKLRGHRQPFTAVRITEIAFDGQSFKAPELPKKEAKPKKAKAEEAPAAEAKSAKSKAKKKSAPKKAAAKKSAKKK